MLSEQSGFGIAALIIWAIDVVLYCGQLAVGFGLLPGPVGELEYRLFPGLLIFALGLNLLGIILALFGVAQKGRSKVLAVLGLILNSGTILLLVCFYAGLLWLGSSIGANH